MVLRLGLRETLGLSLGLGLFVGPPDGDALKLGDAVIVGVELGP